MGGVGGRGKQASDVDLLVAQRIRTHRKERRLSQGELAGKLGVTFQQIQKYEKGVNRVCAGRLFQLARIFDVPVQALFPEEGKDAGAEALPVGDGKRISEFALSLDGWRLCQAFLSISDAKTRKSIIALVQELTGADKGGGQG